MMLTSLGNDNHRRHHHDDNSDDNEADEDDGDHDDGDDQDIDIHDNNSASVVLKCTRVFYDHIRICAAMSPSDFLLCTSTVLTAPPPNPP